MFLIFGLNGYCYSILSKNLAEYYAPESLSPCISITISAFDMSPTNRDHNSSPALYLIEQYALRITSMSDPPFFL